MGRPAKPPSEKLQETMVRLLPREREFLRRLKKKLGARDAKFAAMSMSAFIRHLAVRGAIAVAEAERKRDAT